MPKVVNDSEKELPKQALNKAAIRRVSGSVFLCVLFHCMVNSLQGSWPIPYTYTVSITTCITLIIISMTIVIRNNKKSR